jgi:hypothetical protein
MLRGIHKASSTWLGRALMAAVMGFLVISFAIWGIGDIFHGSAECCSHGGTGTIESNFAFYNDRSLGARSADRSRPMKHAIIPDSPGQLMPKRHRRAG